MSIHRVLALLLIAAPAGAAPLCHDLRGLYTPCAPGQATPSHRHSVKAEKNRPAPADGAPAVTAAAAEAAPPPAAAAPKKPPLFDRAKQHCHDSKGLYTPCPR